MPRRATRTRCIALPALLALWLPAPPARAQTLQTLHLFPDAYKLKTPSSSVTLGPGGVLYGAVVDGSHGNGAIYSLTPPAGGTGE